MLVSIFILIEAIKDVKENKIPHKAIQIIFFNSGYIFFGQMLQERLFVLISKLEKCLFE